MKYIQNTGRYAIAFIITKNNREIKIELDKRRIYMDTGNIATTGITPVEEEDLKQLEGLTRFKQEVKAGNLTVLDESDVKKPEETKMAKLEQENKELQEKLKKAEKADVKKVEEENKALADENASLRKQLEDLAKGKKASDEDAKEDTAKNDTEGF